MNRSLLPAIYFRNAAGQLLEDAAGFLRVSWSSNAYRPEEVRALFTHMAYALRRNNWSCILINQIGMRAFSQEEQQWVTQEWLPLAVQAGYRYGAVVVSEDVMVRLATAYITTQVNNLPLIYRSFITEPEALEWLLQQSSSPPSQRSFS
ncbi:hypothetical protein [Hymenobacter volaticus]|uniref:STAS/SEC14 domain-containing protein n=1 Tax=Hymenobacter volaticus TaxID=2932254 RepID=A0ABY4G6M2_9BACT|nr:hypothetical protein [Hymenobacter volaticus]UOQ66159.1 hypothetical protein MUN86_22135 [Hymenobacter volaticus]